MNVASQGWLSRGLVAGRRAFWLCAVAAAGCRGPAFDAPAITGDLARSAAASRPGSPGPDAPTPADDGSPSVAADDDPWRRQATESTRRAAAGAARAAQVRPASFQATEELPRPSDRVVEGRPVRALDPEAAAKPLEPLTMREVSESIYVAFPALEAIRQELAIAEGKELAAWGEFDLKIKGDGIAAPLGYYKNYRSFVRLEQGVFGNGANVFSQYRLGEGDIPAWYGERETNDGGEFRAGFLLPLLRDRTIDQRRADIFQATLRRQQVDPAVRAALLDFNVSAADAYWSWVAAGLNYDVQFELMRLTIVRNRVYEERVRLKDLAPIELVQNQRLIASRETKVIEAERKLQQSAIKLSLYLRDEQGRPLAPSPALLPEKFPEPESPDMSLVDSQIAAALDARPELVELDLQREQAEIDLATGQNLRRPGLSAVFDAAKDVGASDNRKYDKTPFEMEAGLVFDVPLQRRKAEGKIREAQGKLAQIAAKRVFVENKIEVQIRDANSALTTSHERLRRARENLKYARQLEQAERDRFDAGESDMLRVALQETAAVEAAMAEIEALADYYRAAAALHAARGLDPLAD